MIPSLTIAHLAPYSIKFPLKEHNGRYDWMLGLAVRQAKAGFNVVIYSNPESFVDIPGISWRSAPGKYDDRRAANQGILMQALQDETIDVYHSHFDNLHYDVAPLTTRPVVFTQHWWPDAGTIAAANRCKSSNVWAVPPTKFMYDFDLAQGIQTKGYIYHGIDLDTFRPTGDTKSGRLLLVGRIAPEKNVHTAIAAAKKAGLGLDIIGKITPKNAPYWDELTSQVDGEQIKYLGAKTAKELVGYYSRAVAVIFPSDVHEPFGLVAIEAQACGTPVLMSEGGSRGELVHDGVSGFLCRSVDDFAAAASKASSLSASACTAFAARFDVAQMDKSYADLYRRLTAQIS